MPRTGLFVLLTLLTSILFFAQLTQAAVAIDCVKFGNVLSINNLEILKLKATSDDGTAAGAYVKGTFLKAYATADLGPHFQMKIGPRSYDTLEVYYSDETKLPRIKKGDHVIVCGRYTTNKNGFLENPKSPDGAYLTQTGTAWSPYAEDGFIIIRGHLYQ